ncbi:FG-GAP repeat protein, partial [candidate division WOR-3 bacterium]|nr:FG-GAP repeat protein [candidate division WOR-3 bacterium]
MKIYKGMFKGFFSCILLAVLFSPVFLSGEQGANLPEGIGNSWWGEVQKNIKTSEYEIRWQEKKGAYQSPNRRNNLRFTYFTDGFKAEPRKYDGEMLWSVDLRLVSYGRGRRVITYRKGRKLIVKGNTAEVKGRGIKIQYANNEKGMRQNFVVEKRIKGKGDLILDFRAGLNGVDINTNGKTLSIVMNVPGGSSVMKYGDMKVFDAKGRELAARMEKRGKDSFSIVVEDEEAVYPITIDPLSSTPDWTVESNQEYANLGYSVSTAGDVNGDGFSDVIVGVPYYDSGENNEGCAYVYYGSPTGLSTTPDWSVESNQSAAFFGISVSTAGDVNGDGFSDVIVGANSYTVDQANEGIANVYHGSTTGLSTTPDWTGESNQVNASFGFSVSTAGDVNGDGYSDVIIGALYYDNGETDEGRAYVYFGSSTGLSSLPDWIDEPNQEAAYYGWSVSTAGDVNGDGYSDVIVGAPYYDNGETNEGAAFVYFGSSSGLSITPDWTGESDQADSRYGYSVSTAGDVNGDGCSEVIVGAFYYDNGEYDEGAAFVYYGSSTGLSSTPDWTGESNQIDAYYGRSVSTAGDVNGDGYSDIIVGANHYNNVELNEGRAFVYYGSSSGLSTTPDWTGEPNQGDAEYGWSVSTAGDVNGDGYSDVIIGVWYYTNGETNEGAAFVYYGSPDSLSSSPDWMDESNQADAYFGVSVSTAGDVNGDGYSDVIVGAHYYDNGQTNEGAAFVYYGSGTGLSTTPDWTGESNQVNACFG